VTGHARGRRHAGSATRDGNSTQGALARPAAPRRRLSARVEVSAVELDFLIGHTGCAKRTPPISRDRQCHHPDDRGQRPAKYFGTRGHLRAGTRAMLRQENLGLAAK